MCGIVGYVGTKKAVPILLDGLEALEYRGYDSAGIAVIENNKIVVKKDKGRVKNLSSLDGINDLNSSIGIAHTRWATHGKPSKINSHPHLDNSNTFAVVHNGIIENYSKLKEFLLSKGYTFLSETDTEVIPNLIHYHYINDKKDNKNNKDRFLEAVKDTTDDLIGSYALEILSSDFPDTMIITRKDSPLVVGKSEKEFYISSDIPATLKYTKEFYLLDDMEIAKITKNKIEFFDNNLISHNKSIKIINWDKTSAEKNGFDDFMLKEIYEQPNAILETIGNKFDGEIHFEDFDITKKFLDNINKIYIVGCGTAMHAGLVGSKIIENLCRIPCLVDIASEFRYKNPIIDKKTLCIFISQSGETADTIAALKLAKEKKATTLAISNVIGSSITREADYTIYTHAGPEVAVASTKAYTSQVVTLIILGMYFASILQSYDEKELIKMQKELIELPYKIEQILKNTNTIKNYAQKIYNAKDMFFIGRGIDYCTSLEGALKVKEISYIHAEAYASGELKHGPIALIEKDIPVVSIVTDAKLIQKSISNIKEVITRGAKTLVITNLDIPTDTFDAVITIPETHEFLTPILSIIPLQLLSYYISKEKGLDVDKPRNLAKSVTVE